MKSNCDTCLSHVFKKEIEGGFVNNKKDPGGATNMGITIGTLSAWRKKPVTIDDVKALTRKEASAIYKKQYWDAVEGDDLPLGIDIAVFDYGVTSGPVTAIRALQRVLKVTVDGHAGLGTMQAARKANPAKVISALCKARLTSYKGLKTWKTFGKGWTNRVNATEKTALAMLKK